MGQITKFYLFISLTLGVTAATATAQTQHPSPSSPTTYPHWCQCLGISCIVDTQAGNTTATRNARTLLQNMSARLSSFLPPYLFREVQACHEARTRHDAAAETQARSRARTYLAGLNTIVLIPQDRVYTAHLPASGARVVQECGRRRHLQIRADLAPTAQKDLIRQALSQQFMMGITTTLQRFGDLNEGRLTTYWTEVGGRAQPRQLQTTTWALNQQGDQWVLENLGRSRGARTRIAQNALPLEYISRRCPQEAATLAHLAQCPPPPQSLPTPLLTPPHGVSAEALALWQDAERMVTDACQRSLGNPDEDGIFLWNGEEDCADLIATLDNTRNLLQNAARPNTHAITALDISITAHYNLQLIRCQHDSPSSHERQDGNQGYESCRNQLSPSIRALASNLANECLRDICTCIRIHPSELDVFEAAYARVQEAMAEYRRNHTAAQLEACRAEEPTPPSSMNARDIDAGQ